MTTIFLLNPAAAVMLPHRTFSGQFPMVARPAILLRMPRLKRPGEQAERKATNPDLLQINALASLKP